VRQEVRGTSCRSSGSVLCEQDARLFRGMTFSSSSLRKRPIKIAMDGLFIPYQPVFFGGDEFERMGDQLRRAFIHPAGKLPL